MKTRSTLFGAISLVIFLLGSPVVAGAVPRQIIILRHGEKQEHDGYGLCDVGVQRSLALQTNYLGKGSANSLFAAGSQPAAFFVITLHTLELASPASASWQLPVIDYSAVPPQGKELLDERTQEAANDVLTNPRWNDRVVVMIWEHKHIANADLEAKAAPQPVTLRQLLHLDTFGKRVPKTWSGDNYDYFWIVDYANAGSPVPTDFHVVKQVFDGAFATVPQNEWHTPENLPASDGCEQ